MKISPLHVDECNNDSCYFSSNIYEQFPDNTRKDSVYFELDHNNGEIAEDSFVDSDADENWGDEFTYTDDEEENVEHEPVLGLHFKALPPEPPEEVSGIDINDTYIPEKIMHRSTEDYKNPATQKIEKAPQLQKNQPSKLPYTSHLPLESKTFGKIFNKPFLKRNVPNNDTLVNPLANKNQVDDGDYQVSPHHISEEENYEINNEDDHKPLTGHAFFKRLNTLKLNNTKPIKSKADNENNTRKTSLSDCKIMDTSSLTDNKSGIFACKPKSHSFDENFNRTFERQRFCSLPAEPEENYELCDQENDLNNSKRTNDTIMEENYEVCNENGMFNNSSNDQNDLTVNIEEENYEICETPKSEKHNFQNENNSIKPKGNLQPPRRTELSQNSRVASSKIDIPQHLNSSKPSSVLKKMNFLNSIPILQKQCPQLLNSKQLPNLRPPIPIPTNSSSHPQVSLPHTNSTSSKIKVEQEKSKLNSIVVSQSINSLIEDDTYNYIPTETIPLFPPSTHTKPNISLPPSDFYEPPDHTSQMKKQKDRNVTLPPERNSSDTPAILPHKESNDQSQPNIDILRRQKPSRGSTCQSHIDNNNRNTVERNNQQPAFQFPVSSDNMRHIGRYSGPKISSKSFTAADNQQKFIKKPVPTPLANDRFSAPRPDFIPPAKPVIAPVLPPARKKSTESAPILSLAKSQQLVRNVPFLPTTKPLAVGNDPGIPPQVVRNSPIISSYRPTPLVDNGHVQPPQHVENIPNAPPARLKIQPEDHSIESKPWYHNKLSREDSAALLKSWGKPSSFIVRDTDKDDGYSISILHKTVVTHLRIYLKTDGFYLGTSNIRFSTVDELVKYYQSTLLSLKNGGEVCLTSTPPRRK